MGADLARLPSSAALGLHPGGMGGDGSNGGPKPSEAAPKQKKVVPLSKQRARANKWQQYG